MAARTQRAFATIIRAAERGGKMVKGLLSFARMTASNTQAVDLNALLQEMIQLLERTTLAKVRLEVDLAVDLRSIQGDPGALNHAFMNLCINAVDAMAGAGSLFIRTRNVEPGQVEVQVRDTGTGMTPEVLDGPWIPSSPPSPRARAPASAWPWSTAPSRPTVAAWTCRASPAPGRW